MLESKPRALILMGTRDGEDFLNHQLLSIINQEGVEVDFLVSDDCSTDMTMGILTELIPSEKLSLYQQSTRLGLPENFLHLLREAQPNYEMYAFADQDDLWESDKLITAWRALDLCKAEQPALWVSRVRLIDQDGTLGDVHPRGVLNPSLENSLVDSIGPGCAMVWNQALQHQLRIPNSDECIMHDSWMYLTATILGTVLVEPRPFTKYRLHHRNYRGIDRRFFSRIRRLVETLWGMRASIEMQAKAAERLYPDNLASIYLNSVGILVNGSRVEKFQACRAKNFHRHHRFDNILLGIKFLLFPNGRDMPPFESVAKSEPDSGL